MRNVVLAFLLSQGLFAAHVPPLICASGGAVGTIDLRVVSSSPKDKDPLPLKTISRLDEGDVVRYKPVLRPQEQRKGDVTLVLAPADPKAAGKNKLLIFEPKPAAKAQEWNVPWRTSVVAFVYGPSGLSVKKVEAFLDKDDDLIGELADYADKTSKTEALIAALSANSSREAVRSALQGFSSQFGMNVQLSKTAPMDQQTMVALQTLNPQVASYDPLAGQGGQPVGQTAGLATSVAEMFFGSPVGLAAGGTALMLNLGAMAFPRSEFRSTFSQPMPDDALGLCGKTGPAAVHTRVAFIWAARIPNVAAPRMTVGKANSLPGTVKSPLPLTGAEKDWKYLDRARNWKLVPDRGKAIPVTVQVLAPAKSIELDLGKNVPVGRYSLTADWDWDPFEVNGFFQVRPLEKFSSAGLTPASQDRLVKDSGKVVATLDGGDFEFVSKVEMKKLNDEFASTSVVPFVLAQGLRLGPQDRMDVQIDTSGAAEGAYDLRVTQVDGKAHNIAMRILPPLPSIGNLPVTVNQGVRTVSFEMKGSRLDLLSGVELSRGKATLGQASEDGGSRPVTIELPAGMTAGSAVSMTALVADRNTPLTIAEAVRVVAPRPEIRSVTISPLPSQVVALGAGELPGGVAVSVMLRVANLPADAKVRLECEGSAGEGMVVRPEELTADELFVTFNTGAWRNECAVQATVTSALGDSAPRRIARVVDVPAIDEFDLTSADGGSTGAVILGKNLETIARAGWSADEGTAVQGLPQPVTDGGTKQELQIQLTAPPAADSVLYVWLRGETKARATTVRAN